MRSDAQQSWQASSGPVYFHAAATGNAGTEPTALAVAGDRVQPGVLYIDIDLRFTSPLYNASYVRA